MLCNSKIVLHVTKFEDDVLLLFSHIGTWHRYTTHSEMGCECVVMSSGIDHKAFFGASAILSFGMGGKD